LTKDQTSNHKQTGVKINEIDRLDTLNTDNTELIDSTQINKGDGDSSTSSEAFSVSLLN
jgi:hypothetical protein